MLTSHGPGKEGGNGKAGSVRCYGPDSQSHPISTHLAEPRTLQQEVGADISSKQHEAVEVEHMSWKKVRDYACARPCVFCSSHHTPFIYYASALC